MRNTFLFLFLCLTSSLAAQTLYIANDLGRNGYYAQRQIAELMGRMAETDGPEAVLALGDVHHFEGVESVDDPLWMTNYELIYAHPELMLPWYAVLGNHEYRGRTQAVLDYTRRSRRWMMPARYYTRTFGDSLRIVFLDTTPLITKYRTDREGYPDAHRQSVRKQLKWLERTLSGAREKWVVVVGHHPIYADTGKDSTERGDMQRLVAPILRRHRVAMYVCGHIHNFQDILTKEGPRCVVNSSASLSRPKVKAVDGTLFMSGAAGFSRLTAKNGRLTLEMIDERGEVIHTVAPQAPQGGMQLH